MALSCDVHQNNIQRPSKQNVLTGVIFCMILCLLTHWPENFNPKSWAKLTSPEFPSPFLFCRMRSVFSCSRWLKNFSRPHWAERSSFKICGSRLTAETRQEWYDTNIVEPPPRWTEHLCRWPSSRRTVFFQRTRWLQRDLSFFPLCILAQAAWTKVRNHEAILQDPAIPPLNVDCIWLHHMQDIARPQATPVCACSGDQTKTGQQLSRGWEGHIRQRWDREVERQGFWSLSLHVLTRVIIHR